MQCDFPEPLTKGDGIRYPLLLSPAIWYVLDPLIPVAGTDGSIHLAYVIQLTNHSALPFTIKSFEVVDPGKNNARTGTNQVLTILNEDVTGQVLPYNYPITLEKRNYSHVLEGGQTGAVYLDVTYADRQSVPTHIAHRVSVTESPKNAALQTYTAIDESAAGTVVEVIRNLPNAVPGANPPNGTVDTAAGNHVITDVGGGRFILYAHLAPGSPTVHVGDAVRKGLVLGKLGNSGNTDAPHLHFQAMGRPSPLAAHGLPFVFDHMDRTGMYSGTADAEQNDFTAGKPLLLNFSNARHFDNTMPLTFDLLNFTF